MTDHLSSTLLNSLADGELSTDQLSHVNNHLAVCSTCTSNALLRAMLKSATASAGQRYLQPPGLHNRLARMIEEESSDSNLFTMQPKSAAIPTQRPVRRSFATLGWVAALALFMVTGSFLLVRNGWVQTSTPSMSSAVVTEVSDQHIAALTAGAQLQVVSSDRHTVKPWFQGKIPFTFNLPEDLPPGVSLNGANLAYISGRPVAHLLYSVGQHRVSVFLWQRGTGPGNGAFAKAHSGFHLAGFTSDELDAVAVSDVEAARLTDLVTRIERAQSSAAKTTR